MTQSKRGVESSDFHCRQGQKAGLASAKPVLFGRRLSYMKIIRNKLSMHVPPSAVAKTVRGTDKEESMEGKESCSKAFATTAEIAVTPGTRTQHE